MVPLGEQLAGRKLCDNGPQDFIADSWQNFIFIVLAEIVVDNIEFIDFWMEENSDRYFDGLHIPIGCFPLDLVFTGLHVVDDLLFYDGDLKVEPFSITLG